MSEMRENGVRDVASNLQMYGVLAKKSFTHNSNKWAKRFFVLKDGFLFYYADSERKDFERHQVFNMHPKGVIPLGNCNIEPSLETGHPFTIIIRNDTFNTDVMVAAESEYTREKWLTLLKKSSLVTWHNVQLSDNIIHQYEIQGLQMANEKQQYFEETLKVVGPFYLVSMPGEVNDTDKLQSETLALHDEKQKTEELERLNDELEKEKQKMEELMGEMKTEYEKLKVELDETSQLMRTVEEDKKTLHDMTEGLQKNLESLEQEKKKTLAELHERQTETAKLSQEKDSLSMATESLTENLRQIEQKTQKLLQEKAETETRMQENKEHAEQLEEEKKAITDHALGLKESMKDLAAQKALTEAELKEEILARLDAERRLTNAGASLGRIEHGICSENQDGKIAEEVKEEMMVDVKSLKQFFEKLAFEAKLDSDKPVMVKNTIHARKTMVRRAKTMKYEACMKNRRSKDTDSLPAQPASCHGVGKVPLLSTAPNQSAYSDAIYRRFQLANDGSDDTALSFRHSSMDIATIDEETLLF